MVKGEIALDVQFHLFPQFSYSFSLLCVKRSDVVERAEETLLEHKQLPFFSQQVLLYSQLFFSRGRYVSLPHSNVVHGISVKKSSDTRNIDLHFTGTEKR